VWNRVRRESRAVWEEYFSLTSVGIGGSGRQSHFQVFSYSRWERKGPSDQSKSSEIQLAGSGLINRIKTNETWKRR